MYVEPLITKSKQDSTHNRRVVFSYLQDKVAVSQLFREVSPKIADRPGGYTRILKTGNRLGDNAEMCVIELVDYNENLLATKEPKKTSSRRRRGGGKKKVEVVAPVTDEVVTDATVVEETVADEAVVEETVVEEKTEVAEEKTTEETSEEKENKE